MTSLSPGYFENRIPLKPALCVCVWGGGGGGGIGGGVCRRANYNVAYEETIKLSLRFL